MMSLGMLLHVCAECKASDLFILLVIPSASHLDHKFDPKNVYNHMCCVWLVAFFLSENRNLFGDFTTTDACSRLTEEANANAVNNELAKRLHEQCTRCQRANRTRGREAEIDALLPLHCTDPCPPEPTGLTLREMLSLYRRCLGYRASCALMLHN